uniref:Phosphotyrosine interaction domain containing 1 n=1 Tax=Ornithorhynchus anatinus TaxID=9258 RepID=A0A6I8N3F9_ORNAN
MFLKVWVLGFPFLFLCPPWLFLPSSPSLHFFLSPDVSLCLNGELNLTWPAGITQSRCGSRWTDCIQVTYLGKVPSVGLQFSPGCTEKAVVELWKQRAPARDDPGRANAILEIRPFQVWLHHLDLRGEAAVHTDTFQVARIAYCTADHKVSPNLFAWVYREMDDNLSYQMDCHAVECESKLEAKKLAHAMMEAFKKTFHGMKSDGRIHRDGSPEEAPRELEPGDG